MMRQQTRSRARSGYTLIELLVVIAIIAVLTGLLMAGVMAAMGARARSQTRYELGKLESSMKSGMGEYVGKPQTLPGKLVLCNNLDFYMNPNKYNGPNGPLTQKGVTQFDLDISKAALRSMFGQHLLHPNNGVKTDPATGKLVYPIVYWDGYVDSGPAANPIVPRSPHNPNFPDKDKISVLEGQQCLVFYLSGISISIGGLTKMNGFARDPVNPSSLNTKETFGPYFDFKVGNLVSGYGAEPGFYNYLDPYKLPYAYFGGIGSSNNYISYAISLPVGSPPAPPIATSTPAYAGAVTAYLDATGKYVNPSSFQIISAGRDYSFGTGGVWDPVKFKTIPNGSYDPKAGTTVPAGKDDMANFSTYVLGAPQS